jgi:dsRNA-specific ribonuclease
MSTIIEKSWKNRLQEYCQKNKVPLPNYRMRQQSMVLHQIKFQVSILLISYVFIKEDKCSNSCRLLIYFYIRLG